MTREGAAPTSTGATPQPGPPAPPALADTGITAIVDSPEEARRLTHLGLRARVCSSDADAHDLVDDLDALVVEINGAAANGARAIAILPPAELGPDDDGALATFERFRALAGAIARRFDDTLAVKILPHPDPDEVLTLDEIIEAIRAAEPYHADADAVLPRTAFGVGIDGFMLTDLGNGERLVARYGDELRYVPGLGWHRWDGRRWERDVTGATDRLAKDALRALRREADGICRVEYVHDASEQGPAYKVALTTLKHAKASEHDQRVKAMLNRASKEARIVIRADRLDADRDVLNARNGTVDLRTGELRLHRRDDLITLLADAAYQSEAPAPRWRRFVHEVTDGDEELARYLQRLIGYSATGHVRERKIPVLYGPGDNGKTRFLEAIRTVLGDYAAVGAPDLLLASDRGSRHPTEIAKLAGARFVTCVEVPRGCRFDEVKLKRLAGDERLTGRVMRGDFFDFDPTFTILFAVNHLPRIDDDDRAAWGRIDVVPFRAIFPRGAAGTDTRLAEKLAAERDGIFAWIVEGAVAWYRDGLQAPHAVQTATRDCEAASSSNARWLRERCSEGVTHHATAHKLRADYEAWCSERGVTPDSDTAFGRWLTSRYTKSRGPRDEGSPVVYQGLAPRHEATA